MKLTFNPGCALHASQQSRKALIKNITSDDYDEHPENQGEHSTPGGEFCRPIAPENTAQHSAFDKRAAEHPIHLARASVVCGGREPEQGDRDQ